MEENDQEWLKIKNQLFKPARSVAPSEAFVQSVMAKLSPLESKWTFQWDGFWWKAPALAFGALAILVLGPRLTDLPSKENTPCTQNLLLKPGTNERACELLQGDQAAIDDVADIFWGDL